LTDKVQTLIAYPFLSIE